jgi:hypothetical protein
MEDSHRSPRNDNGQSHYDELKRALVECLAGVGAASFEEREATLMRIANDAVRDVLASELQQRADELSEDVLVDGILYRRHQLGTVLIHSLCGGFELRRWTYRRVGERNGPTCVPVELEAGIVERSTPALAYGLICGYGKWHMRDHERMLSEAHRKAPSRSTLERIAKALGRRAKELTPKFEPLLRKVEVMPEGAHGIVLGLDRTTIPMEEDPDSASPPRVRRTRNKPYLRAPPPPVEVNYRMAYVGTVTIVDSAGEPLSTRRYAVGAHRGAGPVMRRMRRDLRWSLQRKSDLVVGVVQDGAAELRNLMLEALRAEPLVRKYYFVIDFYHVTERIGATRPHSPHVVAEPIQAARVERAPRAQRLPQRTRLPHALRAHRFTGNSHRERHHGGRLQVDDHDALEAKRAALEA